MSKLYEIAERTKERIAERKKNLPQSELSAVGCSPKGKFEAALKLSEDIAFICEVKKVSPSKGVIAENFPYVQIAKEYEAAGAAAISVLTEPFYFHGSDEHLREIAQAVQVPLLRKDFTVDPYMIYEAKALGASAVLLICAILDPGELTEYIDVADENELSALVETRDEHEIETALKAGAKVIGVNNRDLKTFRVNTVLSERLRKHVPRDVLYVAESGITTPDDVARLRRAGADAVLIGETLMRSGNKRAEILRLKGGTKCQK